MTIRIQLSSRTWTIRIISEYATRTKTLGTYQQGNRI